MKARVGLVGAGSICRHHVAALRRLAGVEIVGIHDVDAARASCLAESLGLTALPSLAALTEAGADRIHVLTPPHAHADVALEALERGCHVLVEKPLAQSVEECRLLIDAARQRQRALCVDHSLLFDPLVERALADVRAGIVGEVVSVDILRSSAYPPYRIGRLPPHYRSAGYPFRDLGVHALYLMQAFLGRIEEVSGSWRSLGGDAHLCFDEWRALARCRRGTGQFQLSWNVRPMQHQIVVQGTAGIMRLDLCAMLRTLRPRTHLPNAAERLWGGLRDCFEPLPQMIGNSFRFAAGSLRPFQGLHRLVAAFHQSLSNGGKLPIDLDDAVEVVRFTEQVARAAEDDVARRLRPSRMDERPYVVTGASGALGRAIAARLAERGERVRCFVRRPIDDELSRDRVEQALGDLGDRDAVREAIRDARVVIHAGAATAGDWDAQRAATVEGTRHVLDACLEHGVDKLVHISSMSVVRYIGQDDGDQVSEHTPLEPHPERRGAYTRAKLEAEWLVTTYVDQKGLPAVILRPGHIVGGGIPLITAAVARAIGGAWLVLGEGEVKVPLVRIEDVVEAVLEAADGDLRRGEIVQLIGETPTQNDVLARAGGGAPVLRVPERLLLVAGKMSEPCFAALGKRSPVSSYRLRSAIHGRGYRAANTPLLGWRPLHAAMEGVG